MARLRKVALVDDNETTNFLNKRLLDKLGVADVVVVYTDAAAGFSELWGDQSAPMATSAVPELIFVDLHMPGMTGIEFLEKYQQLPLALRQQTRLAVLTTSMLSSDRERVTNYPGVDYLVKPLSREKLHQLLLTHYPHVQVDS